MTVTRNTHLFGKWSLHFALFALIATATPGCQFNKDTLVPGKACTTQSECECLSCPLKDLLICSDGACHRICNVDSDCAVGEACHAGVCQPKDIACTNKEDCPDDSPCQTYECQGDFCQSDVFSEGTICVPESDCVINAACDNLGQCTGEIETCAPRESTCEDVDGVSFVVYYESHAERNPETCQCNYIQNTTACPQCADSPESKQFCIDCLDLACPTEAGACEANCACDPESVQCACDPEESTSGNKIPCYLNGDTDDMNGVCIGGACEACLDDADCPDDKVCDNKSCVLPVECSGASDCANDNLFCNGDEYCNTDTGYCAHEGTECLSDALCDEDSGVCYACTNDTHCTGETPVCNTGTHTCVACWPNGTPCIDATPSNCKQATCISSACVPDATNISSTSDLSISCKQDEWCNIADDCSPLDDDDDDDDNGSGQQEPASEHNTQTCRDGPGGICVPGNGSPGYCALEDSGTCLECLSDTDCEGDTCDSCGVCGGLGMPTDCDDCAAAAAIPEGQCDCNGNVDDVCGVCGGSGFPEDKCDCEGNVEDECGVCDGPGIPSGCSDCTEAATIPEGECDCNGNVEDECDVCDGPCVDLLPDDCKFPSCTEEGFCTIAFGSTGPGYACTPFQNCTSNNDCSSGVCSNTANLWQHFGFEPEESVEFFPYDTADYFADASGHICMGIDESSHTGFCWHTEIPGGGNPITFPMCLDVQCAHDSNCAGLSETPYCDTEGGTASFSCVECSSHSHCNESGGKYCNDLGSCVACTTDEHCQEDENRPTCNIQTNICNDCTEDQDCTDAGIGNKCCPDGVCSPFCQQPG